MRGRARHEDTGPNVEGPDFDALYGTDADPWRIGPSWYERRKLSILLASLPREHYATAWEPGCGPGIASRALATRVDRLVASDSAAAAVELAADRCADLPHVRVEVSALPEVPVAGPVQLVVATELLYYVDNLQAALDALWSVAAPGSHVVVGHWADKPNDASRSGPDLHAAIAIDAVERDALRVVTHSDRDFMLDIYEATS